MSWNKICSWGECLKHYENNHETCTINSTNKICGLMFLGMVGELVNSLVSKFVYHAKLLWHLVIYLRKICLEWSFNVASQIAIKKQHSKYFWLINAKLEFDKYFCDVRANVWSLQTWSIKNKPGGLDVETNRDRDRERSSCRD